MTEAVGDDPQPDAVDERADAASGGAGPRREPRPPFLLTAGALLAFVAVSQALPWASRAFGGNVPPLFARLDPAVGPLMVLPVAMVLVAWLVAPLVLRLGTVAFLGMLIGFGWMLSVSLAMQAGGVADLTEPMRRPLDYYANVPLVDDLGVREFGRQYPELGERLSLHARTHPPGAVLLLWGLSRAMGGSIAAVSLLVALIGVAGVIPTYLIARGGLEGLSPGGADGGDGAHDGARDGGDTGKTRELLPRVAAVLFVSSPGVLLFSATSLDAVFMTVTALAVAALVRAPESDWWAMGGGALALVAVAFTFGALALAPLILGLGLLVGGRVGAGVLVRRAAVAIVSATLAGVAVWLMLAIDLLATFRAALDAHLGDPSRGRSLAYWAVGNIAAFLTVVGVGHSALLVASVREAAIARRANLAVVLAGILVLGSVTGIVRGETDHIWLFLVPPLAVAVGSVVVRQPDPSSAVRFVAVAGLGQAVLMEALLETFW